MSELSAADIGRLFPNFPKLFELAALDAMPDAIMALAPASIARLALPPLWSASMCKVLAFGEQAALISASGKGTVRHQPSERYFDLEAGDKGEGKFVDLPESWSIGTTARCKLLDRARDELGRSQNLGQIAEDLAKALQSYALPERARYWVALAKHAADVTSTAHALLGECSVYLAENRPVAALALIEAARDLAFALPELVAAADTAGRRIDLFSRRADDLRRLVGYEPIGAAVTALQQLLDGPDELWGLHIAGGGGAGKTMLMRDLTSRYERPRVDFGTHRL
jgi:hypothetical protein